MNVYEGKPLVPEGRLAVVVAKFNRSITQRLLDGALAKFRELGVHDEDLDVCWVPGAFEIPTMTEVLAQSGMYVGILALGAVIKGETSHDEHINRAISMAFSEQGMRFGIPVMFGVLTTNNVQQALERSGEQTGSLDKIKAPHKGNKGAECAEGLLEMINLLSRWDSGTDN